ncbi:MAG: FAD-dependent thymidylate synthase [Nanoarchaeota archaeon]|nr:FAD-dependent thymidylate synthase [Nanoarchaeota archaeon]
MVKYNSLSDVPAGLKAKLSNYFTNVDGDTFVIHGLPPELTGAALARYSRASTGMKLTILNEFLDETGEPSKKLGTALIDRVLNAFGDDSVGELEGVAVGIENISQLLTKEIEDRRIGGSPIEQSTRYVKYDQKDEQGRWRYLRPKEIIEAGLKEKFEKVNDKAFEVYSEGIIRLQEHFKRLLPRESFQIEVERQGRKIEAKESELESDDEKRAFRNAYNFTTRCAALDVGRCVLPSSTLTHLGLGQASNGRFYTNLISHLKTSDLEEAQERGIKLEEELNKIIPTFIKRNRIYEHIRESNLNMSNISSELSRGITPKVDQVTLITDTPYMDQVVALTLFSHTNISLSQIIEVVSQLPEERKKDILKAYSGTRLSRRDRSGRALEAGYPLTFDLVGGFAEYRDLERHRMLTQQRQKLTTDLGFILPPEMGIIGLENEVNEVVDMMDDLNSDLKHASLENVSQYATLFNHRMRFMLGMNLRAFQHLAELRTQPAGHFSYRAMVMKMANQVIKKYPLTENFLGFVDYSDPGNKITRAREQSKIAGRNLASNIKGDIDY